MAHVLALVMARHYVLQEAQGSQLPGMQGPLAEGPSKWMQPLWATL